MKNFTLLFSIILLGLAVMAQTSASPAGGPQSLLCSSGAINYQTVSPCG